MRVRKFTGLLKNEDGFEKKKEPQMPM